MYLSLCAVSHILLCISSQYLFLFFIQLYIDPSVIDIPGNSINNLKLLILKWRLKTTGMYFDSYCNI